MAFTALAGAAAGPPLSDNHACAHCGAPATLTCAACKDAPAFEDKIETKWYCNADCQKADWPGHKSICKKLNARKRLSRAAEIAQSLWYIFREETNDYSIVGISFKNGVHYLQEGDGGTVDRWNKGYRYPFPNQLMPDESMKRAILTHILCTDALGYMHTTIAGLLEGLYAEISEIRFEFMGECRSRRLKSVNIHGQVDEKEYSHHILQVKLKSGEIYVMDLTGAQYGFDDALVPWAKYVWMMRALVDVNTFGYARKVIHEPLGKRDLNDLLRRYYVEMDLGFEAALAEALTLAGGHSLSKLITLPEPAFREKRSQILMHVQARLRLAAELMDKITVKRLAATHNINLLASFK